MTVLLAGATGYVGGAVLRTLLSAGFTVVAVVRRESESRLPTHERLITLEWDSLDPSHNAVQACEHLVSCIASRNGSPDDAECVDYRANQRLLKVAEQLAMKRFVLLSAICVQRPRLAFQHAKLRFEAELKTSQVVHTIIRPTAFFKSLSGQINRVRKGKPFLIVGNGELTACKPIAASDLAQFILSSMTDPEAADKTLVIGGPGPAITPKKQAELLFAALGKNTGTRSVPVALFLALAAMLGPISKISSRARIAREYLRIAHYYATESMLVWDAPSGQYRADLTPEYGSQTLAEFYQASAQELAGR